MDILSNLTPEQLKALTPEQLSAIINGGDARRKDMADIRSRLLDKDYPKSFKIINHKNLLLKYPSEMFYFVYEGSTGNYNSIEYTKITLYTESEMTKICPHIKFIIAKTSRARIDSDITNAVLVDNVMLQFYIALKNGGLIKE